MLYLKKQKSKSSKVSKILKNKQKIKYNYHLPRPLFSWALLLRENCFSSYYAAFLLVLLKKYVFLLLIIYSISSQFYSALWQPISLRNFIFSALDFLSAVIDLSIFSVDSAICTYELFLGLSLDLSLSYPSLYYDELDESFFFYESLSSTVTYPSKSPRITLSFFLTVTFCSFSICYPLTKVPLLEPMSSTLIFSFFSINFKWDLLTD